ELAIAREAPEREDDSEIEHDREEGGEGAERPEREQLGRDSERDRSFAGFDEERIEALREEDADDDREDTEEVDEHFSAEVAREDQRAAPGRFYQPPFPGPTKGLVARRGGLRMERGAGRSTRVLAERPEGDVERRDAARVRRPSR